MRFLGLRLLVAVAIVAVVFFAVRLSAAPGDDTPPSPQVVEVDVTVQGKTAANWHAIAERYLRSTRVLAHAVPPWGTHWLERAFLCIHSHEGRWADPRAPYYGGLQMDSSFQHSYGAWAVRAFGTADRWPVSVQIAVAIRAYYSGRGFGPWPNTARYCGLLP